MRTLLAVLLFVLMGCSPARAVDNGCSDEAMRKGACADPVIGPWARYRYVQGEQASAVVATEAEAVNLAVEAMLKLYPCGFSHVLVDAPWVRSKTVWNWTNGEDSARISYIGFLPDAKGQCNAGIQEKNGTLTLRRERSIICPRGFNWLMRDNEPAVCVRD